MTYSFKTTAGVFSIVRRNERFEVIFELESLGSYMTAQQAAEDLAGGHTFSPRGGLDTSKLGIPYDVSEWEVIP